MSEPKFSLTTDSYTTEFELVGFSGEEAISQMFEFHLTLKVKKELVSNIDFQAVVRENCKLQVEGIEGYDQPYEILGIIKTVDEEFHGSNTHKYYSAIMVPALWRQAENLSFDIYVDKSADVILDEELSQDVMCDYQLSLTQTYPIKPFVCQYSESNFDFVARLANHWGIYYYFDHVQQGKLIFADDTNYDECAVAEARLDVSNNPTTSFNSIRSLRKTFHATPVGVVVSETNPDQASEKFEGLAGETDGKNCIHLVNESCDNLDEAMMIAGVRLEEFQYNATEFYGTSGIPCLAPGFTIKVSDEFDNVTEILITSVKHSADNLDNSHRGDSDQSTTHYQATFTGIPRDVQYRPEHNQVVKPRAISTTARIHSDDDKKNIAQRNDVGKYQVIFDFLKDEKKVSNWIRKARQTARTNHFDMPLTPGTEVQIAFIDGNPDRPYIQSALENSQSVQHPVTNANPHHASIRTDGMLYTEAAKSHQVLHVSKSHDMAEVYDHRNNNRYPLLGPDGKDTGELVDEVVGDQHVQRRYGDRYYEVHGIDFNYGLNAQYFFGQQYREVHAEEQNTVNMDFDLSGKLVSETAQVESFDEGLPEERKAGIVNKEFGNKYDYHTGDVYTWAEGQGQSGGHTTHNFGGRSIVNNVDINAGADSSSDAAISAPVGDAAAIVTKNIGDTYVFTEGLDAEGHIGEKQLVRQGNTTEEVTGNLERTIKGNITENITGDIAIEINGTQKTETENIAGDKSVMTMAAGKIEINTTAGTEISSIEMVPSKKATINGNEDIINLSPQSSTKVAITNENYIGGKLSTFGGVATELFSGAKFATHSGILIENKNGTLGKNQMDIQEAKSAMLKKAQIITLTAALTMVG